MARSSGHSAGRKGGLVMGGLYTRHCRAMREAHHTNFVLTILYCLLGGYVLVWAVLIFFL